MTGTRDAQRRQRGGRREVERRQGPITDRALEARVGRVLDVLVEERVEGEELSLGRAYLQAPDVDGLVVVRAQLSPGTRHAVLIERRNGVDLEGSPRELRPLSRPTSRP